MMPLSSQTRRTLIRVCYFLPTVVFVLLFLHAVIPHVYFLLDNTAYETQSTLGLVANTWKESINMLNGNTEGSLYSAYFAYIMATLSVLYWILLLGYLLTAAAAAICSARAFSLPPTAKETNRAKRWLRFICPNRVIYVMVGLFPLLWTLFPHLLVYFYRTLLLYDITVHFFGPSDLILAVILTAINLTAYLLLLPAQREEHMDMFRLYKAK